jgi:hypothetical protein
MKSSLAISFHLFLFGAFLKLFELIPDDFLKNILLFWAPSFSILFTTDDKLLYLVLCGIFVFVRKNSMDSLDLFTFLSNVRQLQIIPPLCYKERLCS